MQDNCKHLFSKSLKFIRNNRIILFAAAFVFAELLMSPFVHLAPGDEGLAVSFASVAAALLFAVFSMRYGGRGCRIIAVGLAFTLGADFGLVLLLAREPISSMLLFNITQICYFSYIFLLQRSNKGRLIHVAVRFLCCVGAVSIVFILLGERTDLLSIISLFYYANLVCNAGLAISMFKRVPLFAIGLVCFVMCDLFVGFGMLPEYFDISAGSLLYKLAYPQVNMSWVFYLPSQTLIALAVVGKGQADKKDAA